MSQASMRDDLLDRIVERDCEYIHYSDAHLNLIADVIMRNRSLNRDYDIAFYRDQITYYSEKIDECITSLVHVGYNPTPELQAVVEKLNKLQTEFLDLLFS